MGLHVLCLSVQALYTAYIICRPPYYNYVLNLDCRVGQTLLTVLWALLMVQETDFAGMVTKRAQLTEVATLVIYYAILVLKLIFTFYFWCTLGRQLDLQARSSSQRG